MKLALLADIHGNFEALQAVLTDIERNQITRIVVLGDIVFKGPQPERCITTVQSLGVPVIRGNIDELVAEARIQDGFAQNEAHRQALTAEMAWTRARLSEAQLDYLRSLPMMYEIDVATNVRLRCVHATPHSLLPAILPTDSESNLEQLFVANDAGRKPDIVAYAHIHLPYVRYTNGRLLLNTGSVGLPFDGDARASYAVLTVTVDADLVATPSQQPFLSCEIRRIPYDVERSVAAFADSEHPFAASVIQALRAGRKPL